MLENKKKIKNKPDVLWRAYPQSPLYVLGILLLSRVPDNNNLQEEKLILAPR